MLITDKRSEKSAYDYAELAGLQIAIMNLKHKDGDIKVIQWLKKRINELKDL